MRPAQFRLCVVVMLALAVAGGACRKRSASEEKVSAYELSASRSTEPDSPRTSGDFTAAERVVPTIKGVGPTADNPITKALVGNDTQAQVRALNELLMVWEQTNSEQPFTAPEDLVKAGLLSKLPSPPPGMEFVFSPLRHAIEVVPLGVTVRGVGSNPDNPMAKALAGSDAQAHLKMLNELLAVWEQTNAAQPFAAPEDLIKAGLLSRLPNPPPGMKFAFNPKGHMIELVPR